MAGAHEGATKMTSKRVRLWAAGVALVGQEAFSGFERNVMLYSMDTLWREHLSALDHLRKGIHLRSYGQKDPKQEYKREAFELFAMLLNMIRQDVIQTIMLVRIQSREEIEALEEQLMGAVDNVQYQHAEADPDASPEELLSPTGKPSQSEEKQKPIVNAMPKVGRNEPCPCGSGKKFKQCHGRLK
jgi:preprotein translocase subunit SecA